MSDRPFINCHTHIFTADCVPPFLARTIVPWKLWLLLPLGFFVRIARWWYNSKYSPYKWPYQRWYRVLRRVLYTMRTAMIRYFVWRVVKLIVGLIIAASLFHMLYAGTIRPWMTKSGIGTATTDQFDLFLTDNGILLVTDSWWLKALLVIVLLLFFPTGRNLLWFLLTKTVGVARMLPGKATTDILKRYVNILRYARYLRQQDIFTKLTNQYPATAQMVVLPMDMEFMGAGKPKKAFDLQMQELHELKEKRPGKIHPFLFVDPRRQEAGNKPFFTYTINDNRVILGNDCFIKEYMEDKAFAGFKIYPALGYFPFDESLLPLWKYAADNSIPIMTHCIRGTIYYRGSKKKEWDKHPVFEQNMDSEDSKNPRFEPLLLEQINPIDVQEIFTHPLNYACLLKRDLLAKLVAKAKDDRIRELFGYDPNTGELQCGLEDLKICFGHFGGEDEWEKFFEKDRDNFASQLVRHPDLGIEFQSYKGQPRRGKLEQVWHSADWYSIICSLMLQHKNVYADISYILHGDAQIMPLLHFTLSHEQLKERVLYGSDFYVVRNHKSDKNMMADMRARLTEPEFDQIARINPVKYLERNNPGVDGNVLVTDIINDDNADFID